MFRDRVFNSGQWTAARFKSFVVSAIRASSRRWPPKYEALKEAFTSRKTNKKTGKMAMHYRCAVCTEQFVAADVQVDHIEPAVDPVKGWQGFDVFIDRMFCEKEGFQVLCKPCHKTKTTEERKARKK